MQPRARVAMVGTLDAELRERLSLLLLAIGRTDADRITTALLSLGVATDAVDRIGLRRDVKAFVRRYEGRSLGEIKVSALVNEVFAVMRRHRLQLPRELVLILKMVVMTEGMGSQLVPSSGSAASCAPTPSSWSSSACRPWSSSGVSSRRVSRSLSSVWNYPTSCDVWCAPSTAASTATKSQLNIRIDNLDEAVARVEKLGNPVIAGAVTAALIEGLVASHGAGRKTLAAVYATGAGATGTLAAYLG